MSSMVLGVCYPLAGAVGFVRKLCVFWQRFSDRVVFDSGNGASQILYIPTDMEGPKMMGLGKGGLRL